MRFFLIFLLLPLQLFSQDLEGVWTGTIYNDTTRKYIPYEIAITGTKGKLSGYSHTIFSGENNLQETGVKSVKIKKKGDKILIEDDELIYNNYTTPPPKGVRQYSVLTFTSGPEGEYLVGAFNTNRTKEYASATGTINLKKKQKITETKLIPKLDELKLSNSLSFIQPQQEEKKVIAVLTAPAVKENKPVVQPAKPQKDIAVNVPVTKKEPVKIEKNENLIDIDQDTVDYKVDVIPTEDIAAPKNPKTEKIKAPVLTAKKTEPVAEPKKQTVIIPEKKPPVVEPKKEVAIVTVKEEKKQLPPPPVKEKTTTVLVQQPVNKPAVIPQSTTKENSKTNTVVKRTDTVTVPKEKSKEPIITQVPKPVQNPVVTGPVISSEELAKRKIETIRSVDIKSDSIVLTLYDNGEVDGDIVSVILNGQTIMSKQLLTTKALTKTVYITPDLGDSLQLIMYAENLGSIAPNTGLLIIKDGEESYQIRFSGDLQKNSAIILRRKVK
jgi:hypothetical protein